MIARLGQLLSRWSERWVPDPFVLALSLTLIVFAVAVVRLLLVSDAGTDVVGPLVEGWSTEAFKAPLLSFAFKMCLVLVTGHALALSPPAQAVIARMAKLATRQETAALMVSVVACVAALIHWGLGAIVGALVAREVGRHATRNGVAIHYPLLGAAAYSGLAVWHGGLTGSAPTEVARADHFASSVIGMVPMADTVFSSLNGLVTGTLLITIPALFYLLTPRSPSDMEPPDPAVLASLPDSHIAQKAQSRPDFLRVALVCSLGAVGLISLFYTMVVGRARFNLDTVILLFALLGILAHGRLRSFMNAVTDGARGAGAILIQFPLYFGVLGIMKAGGLVAWVSDTMVALSTQTTLPVVAFLSAGLVNLFVPSGGGQWAVQGEILLSAGQQLNVPPGTTVLAFAYGDAWTNMLQPFWALPLLGVMGLRASQIIGYTAVVFLMMGLLVPLLLLLGG